MYWRFGHQNASVIDHLLESSSVSLEELLEQDDLIQECKAQNPRLIEYLRDPTVLQQLLSYITSDDLEDRARFKYPFIACEVIACEVWAIFESALSNIDMLVKFWEFLDRPPPLNPVQASYFAKVIGVFLMKKTSEMLQFIKAQPEVVSKLLLHMSTSSIMDLLLKIISMEESPDGKGTVQWLSGEGLMPWLVNRLDPNNDAEIHSVASQVLLDIIAISQSSHPEQPSIGTNVLIDELKSEVIVDKLVGFMLDRNAPHSTSTLINGVTIFIELIRRNNSDYDVEPLPPNSTEHVREAVDLSDLLKVLASRIEDFKGLLVVPRSVTGPTETSIGRQVPLGFERLKICEMFAELLHCSNMAVLNSRPIISVAPDGTVKVPTVKANEPFIHHSQTVREELAESTEEGDPSKDVDLEMNEPAEAKEVKVEAKTEAKTEQEQPAAKPTQSGAEQLEDATAALGLDDQATPRASPPLAPSTEVASNPATPTNRANGVVKIPVGDFLKMQFVDHQIIPTCFDLFFQFPWNNFLHTVVYDMVHQVFHRPMGDIGRPGIDGTYIPPRSDQGVTEGWNRRLTISIFKDGRLTKRITDAQRLCDFECAQPKGVRLGYMGHLTYIADETVKLLELYSQTSLLPTLYEFIDLEDWWNYVSKVLKETKERDAQVLGGSRPNVMEPHKVGLDDVQDDDFMDDHGDEYGSNSGFLGGDAVVSHEGDTASDQFARYLSQQITNNRPEKFGSSDEDEDDEEGNWIGEYGAETDLERRRAVASGLDDTYGNRHTMDFEDSDEDEGANEDAWNSPWPNTFGDSKVSEFGTTTQFNATLTDWSEDFQDGFTEFKTASSGEDSKDNFGFPPFSVDQPKSTDGTTTATTTNEANPFEDDNFVESASNVVDNSAGTEGLDSKETVQKESTESSKSSGVETNMEPVALAPQVKEAPKIEETAKDSSSKSQDTPLNLGVNTIASTSAPTVNIETVPLVDSGAANLKDTGVTSSDNQSDKTPKDASATTLTDV
ncbi:hypothetical protein BGZ80_000298 [Entomortierella chlamydospora]|uniref:Sit4 phosphatase-associated protein n=1 Tax=Entomortierella chlamydospora TaxID=101097 RepID=A0A9P6MSF0_9FUNG|nr:hypothetical protein BGZ80_000298 [Entomortierella chlamydospora]